MEKNKETFGKKERKKKLEKKLGAKLGKNWKKNPDYIEFLCLHH